jgi:uncharacterized membrane protein HdeD (DUF308 family)
MDTWILIAVIGLLILMVGLILIVKKFPDKKQVSQPTLQALLCRYYLLFWKNSHWYFSRINLY